MSIIVTATPISLLAMLGPSVLGIAMESIASNVAKETEGHALENIYHVDKEYADKLLNKELKTNIVSKDVLLKTLKEHGAEINEIRFDTINCSIENLNMKFTKNFKDEPYSLYVEYNDENDINFVVKEISEEYTVNAQEASYNHIMENIKTQNLSVEQEEILEDNTIVLTVNLE